MKNIRHSFFSKVDALESVELSLIQKGSRAEKAMNIILLVINQYF